MTWIPHIPHTFRVNRQKCLYIRTYIWARNHIACFFHQRRWGRRRKCGREIRRRDGWRCCGWWSSLCRAADKGRREMWRRKRGNVRTITAAARERLIKWHLAQWASAQRSWWRRERMGIDSRERNGRRDVRAALAGRHGGKEGTSTKQLFFLYVCVYGVSGGKIAFHKWQNNQHVSI